MNKYFPNYINEVYIMLTEFCPLRCEYCYISDRTNKNKIGMSTIDNIFKAFPDKKIRVIFFGGEPLMEFELLKETYYKYKKHARFQVVTSGLVNFDKFINLYKEEFNNFELQISWDGTKTSRVMKDGTSKQNDVYDNILKAANMNLGFQVRCVINDTNVDNFYNTYLEFYNFRKQFKVTGDFTIAHQLEFSDNFTSNLSLELSKILNDIREKILTDKPVYIPQLILRYLNNILSNHPKGSCDAGNYIVIRPNGDIYPCTILSQDPGEYFKMGNINRLKNISCDIIEDIKIKPLECVNCSSNSICDGGCRYERYNHFKSDWTKSICTYNCKNMDVFVKVLSLWYKSLDLNTKARINKILIDFNNWSLAHQVMDTREKLFSDITIEQWLKKEV